MQFSEFTLHERLQRAVTAAGFHEPTPIQAAALPIALAGQDLVGTAQTGTGKTAAFVLPILHRLLTTPITKRQTRALILTPTRELAEQIHTTIQSLARHTNLRSATVYGGVGMAPQERALRNGTEIIVACPGRLLDHVARGNTDLTEVECLVLDEADRMLDMGFLPPITRIVGLLPETRQTMLFSATFAPALNGFVDKTLRTPQRIAMDIIAPADTVTHALYPVPAHLKTTLLKTLLRTLDTNSVLIFTRTKHRADHIAEQLTRAGFPTGALHSNKSQNQRQNALDGFRNGNYPCLVATDIAARGIDVSTISHVINYDVPDCADTYIHRIGRTGRAAQTGEALTFVTLDDTALVRDIERQLKEPIEKRYLDNFDYHEVRTTVEKKPKPAKRENAPSNQRQVAKPQMAAPGKPSAGKSRFPGHGSAPKTKNANAPRNAAPAPSRRAKSSPAPVGGRQRRTGR